jgi:hypothetical protein
MTRLLLNRLLRILAVLTLSATAAAFAQAPAATPGAPPAGGQQPRRPAPTPTNLKVLPKDTTGDQVRTIMRGYEKQLGVECEYCHAKDPATGRNNFASDANPKKDVARIMMKMTASINGEYLTQLTDPKPENPVTCGTCHRGMAKPTVFVPPPSPPRERPAVPPAAAPAAPPAQ